MVILAVAVVLLVSERLRPDVVGLLVIAALGLTNVLKPKELLVGFSNEAIITIAAMFVLSAALMRTGMVAALGAKLVDVSKGSSGWFLFLSLSVVCVLSAFINNTPIVVVFIPAILTACAKMGQSPSKFLMPISFASMFGGSCTLIGTSSNLLVSSLSEEMGYGALGMFEFAPVGVFIVIAGMAYLLLFSRRFLPERVTLASTLPADAAKQYVTEVSVGEDSPLVGKTLSETVLSKAEVTVVELIRGDSIQRLGHTARLMVGDVLLIRGDLNEILNLDRLHTIDIAPELTIQEGSVKRVEMTLAELMIGPGSPLIGRTCRHVGLRRKFGVLVFAIQRRGRHHQRQIADIELRMGDILLVRGTMEAITNLRSSEEFVLLEGVQEKVVERHKAPVAVGTIAVIVLLASFGVRPISVLSLAGVGLILITRVLTVRQAYAAIDWSILVLIAGMIAMGHAMQNSGAFDLVAGLLTRGVGDLSPTVTLWVFYFITMIMSLVILHKPTAVLMTPLAVTLAVQLDVPPKPFIMAVAFATSTALATPMGYQTNLLVYGPGGYTFKDFVKFGLPLNIVIGIVACVMISIVWPFTSSP